jgi:hypothetical protein
VEVVHCRSSKRCLSASDVNLAWVNRKRCTNDARKVLATNLLLKQDKPLGFRHQTRPSHSIRRVSRSLPRVESAFQHLGVLKALFPEFRCLTDSGGFAGSGSIEDNFLSLRQRSHARLKAGERYRPFQVEHPAFGLVLISANEQGLVRLDVCTSLLSTDSLDVCHASPPGIIGCVGNYWTDSIVGAALASGNRWFENYGKWTSYCLNRPRLNVTLLNAKYL